MDQSLNYYQSCIKELLSTYETMRTEHSKVELIFDDERGHYMAVRIGWFNQRYTHFCLVHIEICDGQVIIHCNNTEERLLYIVICDSRWIGNDIR